MIVQEANLCLDLLLIKTLRKLFSNVLSHFLDNLGVHAVVVGSRVIETTVIKGDFHFIIHKEGVFVGIIKEKCWVVEGLRN